jgi:hypothetical protein
MHACLLACFNACLLIYACLLAFLIAFLLFCMQTSRLACRLLTLFRELELELRSKWFEWSYVGSTADWIQTDQISCWADTLSSQTTSDPSAVPGSWIQRADKIRPDPVQIRYFSCTPNTQTLPALQCHPRNRWPWGASHPSVLLDLGFSGQTRSNQIQSRSGP